MARPGRKRKFNVKREPNGRVARQGPDKGTDQLQARRVWLAQGGDLTKTSYPLGVMLANDVIGEPEHSAGVRYGWLHLVLFGRATPAACAYGGAMGRGPTDPETDEQLAFLQGRELELRNCDRVLGSPQTVDLIYALIVDGNFPQWLLPKAPQMADLWHARNVISALQRLALHMGYRNRILKKT